MDRKTAENLRKVVLAVDAALDDATSLTSEIEDVDERKAIRRAIANVTDVVHDGLIRAIVKQYPDLDPDRTAT
jgi:hypothetical protein